MSLELAVYQTLFQSASDGILLMMDDQFVECNTSILNLFNCAKKDLMGQTLLDFSPPTQKGRESALVLEEKFDMVLPNKAIRFDWVCSKLDKSTFNAHILLQITNFKDKPLFQFSIHRADEHKDINETLVKRAAELETVAEVSTATSTILDTKILLQTVVDLTKDRFNLYHAHIYLLGETGNVLELTAGAGKVGQQMVDQSWQIPLVQEHSLVARAARTHQGIIINDVRQTPDFLPNPLLPNTSSEMAVPMMVGEQVLGVLDVQAEKINYFSQEDINTYTTLASQVAAAIQNARLYEQKQTAQAQTEAQAKRLTQLNELSTELNLASTEMEIFQIAARYVPQILQNNRASIALLSEEKKGFEVLAIQGAGDIIPVGSVISPQESGIASAINQKKIIRYNDIRQYDWPDFKALLQTNLHSVIVAPLFVRGQAIGSLNVARQELNSFTRRDEEVIQQLSSILSAAIENRRLLEEMKQRGIEQELLLVQVQRLAGIVENHTDFIGIGSLEGQAIYVNPTGLKMMGLTPDYNISEMTASDFYPPTDAETLIKVGIPTALKEGSWSNETNLLRKDGSTIPVDQTISINYNVDGEPYSFSITMRDITSRKEAEAERERLLAEIEVAYRQSVRQDWREYLTQKRHGNWRIEHQSVNLETDLEDSALTSIRAEVAREGIPKIISGTQENGNEVKPAIVAPISLYGQVIGTFSLQDIDPNRRWTDDEIKLIGAITEQLALTVENLRLVDETQQRAAREQTIADLTQSVWAGDDIRTVLHNAVTKLGQTLDASNVVLRLGTDKTLDQYLQENKNQGEN